MRTATSTTIYNKVYRNDGGREGGREGGRVLNMVVWSMDI
jgi:hypothetical protein